MATLKTWF